MTRRARQASGKWPPSDWVPCDWVIQVGDRCQVLVNVHYPDDVALAEKIVKACETEGLQVRIEKEPHRSGEVSAIARQTLANRGKI